MSIEYFTSERLESDLCVHGYNGSVPVTEEDVWEPSQVWVPLAAATTLDICSTSVADVLAGPGTGAQQVRVFGLDANYAPLVETVDMSGSVTVPVVTTGSYLRVLGLEVVAAGSGGKNAGTITAASSAATWIAGVPNDLTLIQAQIAIGENMSHNGFWTAPAGKNYKIISLTISSSIYGMRFNLWQKLYSGYWTKLYTFACGGAALGMTIYIPFDKMIDIPARSDITIKAMGLTAAGIATTAMYLKRDI